MKIIHCADLHIREKDLDEIEICLNKIIDTAIAELPDLCVIAGDIFDNRDVKLDSRAALQAIGFVSALANICPIAIVIGTPSHDGNAPAIMRHVRGNHPVLVAEKPMQVILSKGAFMLSPGEGQSPEAILSLVPQPTKQFFPSASDIRTVDQEISQAMSGLFMGFGAQAANYQCPHILVYHGGISGAKVSTGQILSGQEIEISTDQFNLAGVDLNLCGHIHASQQIGDRTFYAGSPYRTNWGEAEAKGFYIHELINDSQKISRFIETPAKKTFRYAFDYTDISSLKSLDDDEENVAGAHIRIDAKVWQDEVEKINFDDMKAELLGWGAESIDLRIIRVPRENVRAEAVLKADSLKDKVQRMAELRNEDVEWSVLVKAEALETKPAEELYSAIAGRVAS